MLLARLLTCFWLTPAKLLFATDMPLACSRHAPLMPSACSCLLESFRHASAHGSCMLLVYFWHASGVLLACFWLAPGLLLAQPGASHELAEPARNQPETSQEPARSQPGASQEPAGAAKHKQEQRQELARGASQGSQPENS